MPYIPPEIRPEIDAAVQQVVDAIKAVNGGPGGLNYAITRMIRLLYSSTRYADINEAIGVLQCVILEHYRDQAGPYEDQKKQENGDVL